MKFASLHVLKAASKRKKHIIPCIVTLLNACCGFLSIINSIEGNVRSAAYCIIIAACMDMLDGRIARALRSTSTMGMELDSLADAVSFCVAPAILLYGTFCTRMPVVALISLSIYLCAGLSRLARFNITPSSFSFMGLPTPIAACFMAQFVLQEQWLVQEIPLSINKVRLMVPLLLSILMISRVPYPSFKKMSPTMTRILVMFGFLICVLSTYQQISPFALGICAYIALGWTLCVHA